MNKNVDELIEIYVDLVLPQPEGIDLKEIDNRKQRVDSFVKYMFAKEKIIKELREKMYLNVYQTQLKSVEACTFVNSNNGVGSRISDMLKNYYRDFLLSEIRDIKLKKLISDDSDL